MAQLVLTVSEELRIFGVFEKVTERIDTMAEEVPELFEEVRSRKHPCVSLSRLPSLQVLHRLEKDCERDLVIDALSLITCSRGGLLESEMIALLGTDCITCNFLSYKVGNLETNDPLHRSRWSRLYRGIRNYLRPPGESGEGVLDFFHQQMPKVLPIKRSRL